MASFEIAAQPLAAWQLSLQGSEGVQFNGALLRECMAAAVECAMESGCLTQDAVQLTDLCAETLKSHDAETNCVAQGFGLRVAPSSAIQMLPKKQRETFGEWLP